MNNKEILFEWLNKHFDKGIPSKVKALYLNLVESGNDIDVELFGIGSFDPNDEDWACNDIYQGNSIELLKIMERPSDWENALQNISALVSDYVALNHEKTTNISRIGVGFGDSETVLVKNEI